MGLNQHGVSVVARGPPPAGVSRRQRGRRADAWLDWEVWSLDVRRLRAGPQTIPKPRRHDERTDVFPSSSPTMIDYQCRVYFNLTR